MPRPTDTPPPFSRGRLITRVWKRSAVGSGKRSGSAGLNNWSLSPVLPRHASGMSITDPGYDMEFAPLQDVRHCPVCRSDMRQQYPLCGRTFSGAARAARSPAPSERYRAGPQRGRWPGSENRALSHRICRSTPACRLLTWRRPGTSPPEARRAGNLRITIRVQTGSARVTCWAQLTTAQTWQGRGGQPVGREEKRCVGLVEAAASRHLTQPPHGVRSDES